MRVWEACYWLHVNPMVIVLLLGRVSLGLDLLNILPHHFDLLLLVGDSLLDLVSHVLMNIG